MRLLFVSAFGLLLPTPFVYNEHNPDVALTISHITSIVMIFMYAQLFYWVQQNEESSSAEIGGYILSARGSLLCLLFITILVCVYSEILVSCLDIAVQSMHLTKPFVGVILLPIAGIYFH